MSFIRVLNLTEAQTRFLDHAVTCVLPTPGLRNRARELSYHEVEELYHLCNTALSTIRDVRRNSNKETDDGTRQSV